MAIPNMPQIEVNFAPVYELLNKSAQASDRAIGKTGQALEDYNFNKRVGLAKQEMDAMNQERRQMLADTRAMYKDYSNLNKEINQLNPYFENLGKQIVNSAMGLSFPATNANVPNANPGGFTPYNKGDDIGWVTRKFESINDPGLVDWSDTDGTTYGMYQYSTKPGAYNNFLGYLDTNAPDIAKRLRNAGGPADTGSKHGAVPDMWRLIAKTEPERFRQLQENYARESYYKPLVNMLHSQIGLNPKNIPLGLANAIFSTAIQHGPTGGAKVFRYAHKASGDPTSANYLSNLVKNLYRVRGTQFPSSAPNIRQSILNRFKKEEQIIQNMLITGKLPN